jgi:hypothetical protein
MLIPNAVWGLDVAEVPPDITPPTTTAYVPYMSGNHYLAYTNREVHVTLTSTDNSPDTIQTYYRINTGEWQTYGIGPIVFTQEGQYAIEFFSRDSSNNEEEITRTLIGIDRTAPLTSRSITSGGVTGDQLQYSEDVSVTLSAADELSGMDGNFPSAARIEYRQAGEEWQRYSAPIEFNTIGEHKLEYRSVDAVGNQEGIHSLLIPIVNPVLMDVVAPYTSRNVSFQLGNHYYTYTNQKNVEVTLTASDDVPGELITKYRMNAGPWQIYDRMLFLDEEGEYKLEYYSVDAAGNTEETKNHTFGMDWTAPQTSRIVTSGGVMGEKSSYATPVTVALSATDALSGMIHEYFPPTFEKTEYRISEGEWQKYESPIVLSAVGVHKLEYRSMDVAGNGEAIQSIEIKIVEPPVTPPVTPPATPPVIAPSTAPSATPSTAVPVKPSESSSQSPISVTKSAIKSAEGGDQAPAAKGLNLSQVIAFTSTTGNQTDKPIIITLHYVKSAYQPSSAIYYYNEAQKRWIYVGGKQHADGSISASVNQFAQYAVFAYKPNTFSDLETHWSQPYVDRLIGMGVIRGFEDGSFRPDDTVTRAQFVKMIIHALGIDVPLNKSQEFVDQDRIPEWALGEVQIALQIGLLGGYEDQGSWYFIPQQKITRQEIALILDQALKYFGSNTVGSGHKKTTLKQFNDEANIADWAKDAIQSSIDHHLIQGYSDGSFRPEDLATRGEAATMLNKLLEALHI